MTEEPTCHTRQCVFFEGVKRLGQAENTEVVYCKAFPNGIPVEIAYGKNKHLKTLVGQDNNIIFKDAIG